MTDTKTDPAAVAAEYREKARKMREVAARTLYDEEAFGCITSVANDAGAEHCDRLASVLEAAAARIAALEAEREAQAKAFVKGKEAGLRAAARWHEAKAAHEEEQANALAPDGGDGDGIAGSCRASAQMHIRYAVALRALSQEGRDAG